ncbi:phytanoyl-CoA dioxygenase [Dyella psychrodurans]|uniref:Phytanoyl-CoA dioxygenase n=1 Tax=Dyella psychrodurans TaxID=1927960 RepID=A0A370XE00_9GAMM|nr:phytanoyl-CoA dioxygenase [Dyella psychrodurans]
MRVNEAESTSAALESDGFAILSSLVSHAECDKLIEAIAANPVRGPGSRSLLGIEPVLRTGVTIKRHSSIEAILSPHSQLVQCSLFAKETTTNWSVTPHQDLSIPVRERVDSPGWTGWSRKEGVWYVQPPEYVLEQLVAVRLQLDDHSSETGPLEVVPKTHSQGRLSNPDILKSALSGKCSCVVPRGGAVVMRPLLIHSSGRSRSVRPRRVLHFLFGPPLPSNLAWANAF